MRSRARKNVDTVYVLGHRVSMNVVFDHDYVQTKIAYTNLGSSKFSGRGWRGT
jgi:hypothetical protein